MAKLTGTNPDQVPTNADLGTMAYQDKDNVNVGSFTSNGIDDNATSTAMTLDASGNLLVGLTSSTDGTGIGCRVRGDGFLAATREGTSSQPTVVFNKKTNDGEIAQFQKNGSTVGSIGNASTNLIVEATSSNRSGLSFGGSITPRRGGANSDNAVDLGIGSIRFKDLYLSGGVYLGGTGAANKLEDYEEGTWTPNGNWTSPSAVYRKIGSVVHITMDLTANSTGGTSQITNLPFSCNRTIGTGIYTSGVNWNNGYTAPTIAVAGNIIYFRAVGDNLAFSAMAITANATVHASFTYETTA